MKLDMKPNSVIKADLGIQKNGPVHAFFTATCALHMDKYVPFRSGDLASTVVENGVVTTRSTKKPFSAPFKLTDAENQTPLIYTLLHMRRIETFWKGMRFQDIKRYGIEFVHELDGEPSIVFKRGDLRGALQLPQDVIDAGLEANPR